MDEGVNVSVALRFKVHLKRDAAHMLHCIVLIPPGIQILGGLGQWVGECVSSSFGYGQSVNEIVTKTDDPALANDF